ncbi:MAG TPA: PAS domain S-box protein, partial [Pedobacter sp.]
MAVSYYCVLETNQQTLKSAESIYERIVEASPYPVYLCSGEDLVITVANKAALKAWDKDESILGMRFIHALPEQEGQPFIKLLEQVYRSGETYIATNDQADMLIDGQYRTFYYNFSYQAMRNELGSITGVLCFATDVTDIEVSKRRAVKSQQDFQDSESLFRTMAESTEVLISISDESGNATYFNKAWSDLTGKQVEELLSFGWVELIHPDDKASWVNIYKTAHREQQSVQGEFRVRGKSGDFRWLLAKSPTRFNADGTFAGYISSFVDITDRKQWELSLERSTENIQI